MTTFRGVLPLALACVLGVAEASMHHGAGHGGPAGGGGAAMSMDAMNKTMLAELRPLTGRAFEVAWTRRMIDHHALAVAMARTALQRSKTPQIRTAAQQVITAQQKELALMNGWLNTWKQPAYTPKVMAMAPAAGQSADRWFLTEMIPHHQGAVDMSRLVPDRSQNAALRTLARQIISDQTREIMQYRMWLKTVK